MCELTVDCAATDLLLPDIVFGMPRIARQAIMATTQEIGSTMQRVVKTESPSIDTTIRHTLNTKPTATAYGATTEVRNIAATAELDDTIGSAQVARKSVVGCTPQWARLLNLHQPLRFAAES